MTSARTWLAAGVTSGAGILSAGLNLKGFSSALVNGVGSTLSAGITTGDWSESFKTGAISATVNYLGGLLGKGISQGLGTENAYTKELINNYTTFGMRKLLGSDEKFDMGSISQVDTMNLVVQDMYQSYKAKDKTSKAESDPHEKSSEDSSDKFKDPFATLDQALSGIFVSLGRGLGQTMKDVANVIKNGAVATWQGVSNFGESVHNFVNKGQFATDEEMAVYARIQKAIANGTALEEGTKAFYDTKAKMGVELTQNEQKDMSPQEKEDYYNLRYQSGYPLSPGEVTDLLSARSRHPEYNSGYVQMAGDNSNMQHGKFMNGMDSELVQPYQFKTKPQSKLTDQWARQGAGISTNKGTSIGSFGHLMEETTKTVEDYRTGADAVSKEKQALTNVVIACIETTLNEGDLSKMKSALHPRNCKQL